MRWPHIEWTKWFCKTLFQTNLSSGIFRLRPCTPEKMGICVQYRDIKHASYTDKITIQKVEVFQDMKKKAIEKGDPAASGRLWNIIPERTSLKVEFANAPAKVQAFSEVVHTSGQIMASPADEALLTAQISGIVSFVSRNLVPGTISSKARLFSVKTMKRFQNNLVQHYSKPNKHWQLLKASMSGRVNSWNRIISEKSFRNQLRYENAQTQLENAAVTKSF